MMRKYILLFTVLLTATALSACGNNEQVSEKQENESSVTRTNEFSKDDKEANNVDLTQLPEYSPIKNHIDLDAHHPIVLEDNEAKRIILFRNDKKQEKYKSIFIKEEERVKIIDLEKGEIFNGLLK